MSDHPDARDHGRSSPTRGARDRELDVAREIAEATLTAATPVEVYRRALGRVTPLVDASFASVFLRDPADPRLLRLVCAHNWPQSVARWLGETRIMVGRGPTGGAVGRNRAIEVPDVFADAALEEWWAPARELGFASMVALPLTAGARAFGALSFYFAQARALSTEERSLLGIVAHQLAATAERARLQGEQDSGTLTAERQGESVRRIAEADRAGEGPRRGGPEDG